MKDGSLKDLDIENLNINQPKAASEGHHYEEEIDINYRYCTECRIKGANIDKKDLRNKLKKVGDSLIVAGSTNRIHVHIHANKPAQVFSICERFAWDIFFFIPLLLITVILSANPLSPYFFFSSKVLDFPLYLFLLLYCLNLFVYFQF